MTDFNTSQNLSRIVKNYKIIMTYQKQHKTDTKFVNTIDYKV